MQSGYATYGQFGGTAPYAYSYPSAPYMMQEETSDLDSKDGKSIRIREKSYSAFAQALIAAEKPDPDEVLQWYKQLTRNDNSSYNNHQPQLNCVLLLSAMGEQDTANQLFDRALLDATKSAQNQNEQNSRHQVQVEGVVIRDPNVWQHFIEALFRMGEYEEAVKMLRAMRENMSKLQAAGENVYWNSTWNNLAENLATFSALEGDLDRALEYSGLMLTKAEQESRMQNIATQLFRQGRMDELKRVTESENYPQRSGYSFVDPNTRFRRAKEIAKTGSREEVLAALQALFEPDGDNNPGIPRDAALQNELGLLFLQWDDGPNARKLFIMVNDTIKSTLQQQSRQNPMYQDNQFPYLLAARYRAGLTGETLDFAKTIKEVPGCILFLLTLAEEIANESNKDDVRELLNAAWLAAMTLEPNPGITDISDPYRGGGPVRMIFRNDYLWAVARAALVADCLPEAERYIQEAKTLDANIPIISVKVRMMLNPNYHHQAFQIMSQRDQLWMSCVDKILNRNRNNINAAMIAAGNIESPHARNNACVRISQTMLKNPGE
jgi:pentatricopeptide repeat protein